jgi:serine protease inhibitor
MSRRRRLPLRAAVALLALARLGAAQAGSDDPDEAAWRAEYALARAEWHATDVQLARVQDLQSSGVTRSEARFGLELLRQVVAEAPEANHLVAPLGAFLALNLVAEGANAQVRERLEAVLHVRDLDRPSLRRALGTLRATLLAYDSAQIDIASSIWLGGDLEPAPAFVAVAAEHHGASVARLDLASPEALETINAWASQATRGALPRALDAVPADRSWLLTTMTSVTASWFWPFEREESEPHPFTDAKGRVTQPVMMHSRQMFPFGHDADLGARIVGLSCTPEFAVEPASYKGCTFWVLLPDADRSQAAVLERLTDGPLRWRLAQLAPQSGDVTLPRFEHRSRQPMAGALERLGLKEATKDSALPDIAQGTSLGLEILDANWITVDEDGPRAASVIATTPFGIHDEPPAFSFVADRPFIYLLVDDVTGALLFAGVVAEPG